MLQNITYVESIPCTPQRSDIFTRLGYRNGTTVLSEADKIGLEASIQKSLIICSVKGAYGRFKIIEKNDEMTMIEGGAVLKSRGLSTFLRGSGEVLLMSSTLGSEITDRIAHEISVGDATFGIIMDAVASEYVDSGLDKIMEHYNKILAREGTCLTKHRYSPGFSDLSLEYQKTVYDLLKLHKIGLGLTEKFMLIPEKSVIAIAGIRNGKLNE